jgi:transcriptional regulator with XRE-family HTH domain
MAKEHPLRIWRKKNKVSLEELGFRVGMSAASISRIERRKQFPLLSAVTKFMKATNQEIGPVDFLL